MKVVSRIAKGNERLREARIAVGYSQHDLATLVGVSEHTITKWETGRSTPEREMQVRVAEALNVKRWEVFQ